MKSRDDKAKDLEALRKELEQSPLADLHAIAAEVGVEGFRRMRRDERAGRSDGGSSHGRAGHP